MSQALDFIVNAGVFFDKGIGLRNISFRLVIVVVRNEVLNCVIGQQLFKFICQLSGESFIWSENQGRAL